MIRIETTVLDEDVARQYRAAVAAFVEWECVAALADEYAGGMIWKRVKSFEYLVRTSRKGKQTSLGRRTADAETRFESFFARKAELEARVKKLRKSMGHHERVNKALRVGRVPTPLIGFLQKLHQRSSPAALVAIGPESLFAYESAATRRFDASLVPTAFGRSDASQPLVLATHADAEEALDALRVADASIKPVHGAPGQFRSASGLEVMLISADLVEPVDPAVFWAAPKRDLAWLAAAPRWSEVVVGSTGRMARLPTVDPRALVMHLDWRASMGIGDTRAIAIAEAVERLVGQALPQFDFAKLPDAAEAP